MAAPVVIISESSRAPALTALLTGAYRVRATGAGSADLIFPKAAAGDATLACAVFTPADWAAGAAAAVAAEGRAAKLAASHEHALAAVCLAGGPPDAHAAYTGFLARLGAVADGLPPGKRLQVAPLASAAGLPGLASRLAAFTAADRKDRVAAHLAAVEEEAASLPAAAARLRAVPGVGPGLPAEMLLDVFGSLAEVAAAAAEAPDGSGLCGVPVGDRDARALAAFFGPRP